MTAWVSRGGIDDYAPAVLNEMNRSAPAHARLGLPTGRGQRCSWPADELPALAAVVARVRYLPVLCLSRHGIILTANPLMTGLLGGDLQPGEHLRHAFGEQTTVRRRLVDPEAFVEATLSDVLGPGLSGMSPTGPSPAEWPQTTTLHVRHPNLGLLAFRPRRVATPDGPSWHLICYLPEASSRTAQLLPVLYAWTRPRPPDYHEVPGSATSRPGLAGTATPTPVVLAE